jgi:CRISPR-associated protein Csx10
VTTRIEIALTFDGPFNVGAGALGGSLADKPLTRDARGLPMVPASAFKGRLRHEVERLSPLLRPDAPRPCGSPVAENMCQGDAEPCPVCRLFGSSWHVGRLTFSDLLLVEPDLGTLRPSEIPPSDLRYGVGLSRQRRVAEDQLLYTTEVFLPGTPITLKGTITGDLDDQDLELLRAGLESLFTVGGGKTKGIGWYDLTVNVNREPDGLSGMPAAKTQDEWLDVIVRLESPVLLGTDANEAFYNMTRAYIPGSVLRGSLAKQMATRCAHAAHESHENCDFGRLFGSNAVPTFEHLYPTTAGGRELSFPPPLTARSCKYHPGFARGRDKEELGHGVGDILIRQVVFEEMLGASLPLPVLYQPRCPQCQSHVDVYEEFLVMARADLFDNVPVPIRRTSRTAINRQRAVAADGQLYTLESVEPMDDKRRPTTFRGRVRASPEQIEILAHWLPKLAGIGQKQTSGLGKVKIEIKRPGEMPDPLPSLADRIKAFNSKLKEEWEFYERVLAACFPSDTVNIPTLPDDVLFFSVDLLSPASLYWHSLPITSPPPEMLGFSQGVRLQRAFADYQMIGGWHQGAKLPRRTQLAAAMGSVFLYRSEGYTLDELVKQLETIEADGIGADRVRGLGRVVICLPFHYQPEVNL